jgi:hypothetical protein
VGEVFELFFGDAVVGVVAGGGAGAVRCWGVRGGRVILALVPWRELDRATGFVIWRCR